MEKLAEWKWGKNSPEAKAVEKLYAEWAAVVIETMELQVSAKKKKKIDKASKLLVNFAECQKHGGPITAENIEELLDALDTKQLLREIKHLRNTTTPNIRQQHKVGNKMEVFQDAQLRDNIRSTICPTSRVCESVEDLLLPFVEQPESHEHNGKEVLKEFNDRNVYRGTVRESFGPSAKRLHRVEARKNSRATWVRFYCGCVLSCSTPPTTTTPAVFFAVRRWASGRCL